MPTSALWSFLGGYLDPEAAEHASPLAPDHSGSILPLAVLPAAGVIPVISPSTRTVISSP